MRRAHLVTVILAASIASGCAAVESTHPLGAEESATHDAGLIGVWQMSLGGEEVYLHVTKDKAPWLKVAAITHSQSGGYELTELRGFTSIIDGRRFLNIHGVVKGEERREFVFIGYRFVDADHVEASPLNLEVFKRAVDEGVLAGSMVSKAKNGTADLALTSKTSALSAFIKATPSVLLPPNPAQLSVLTRMVPKP